MVLALAFCFRLATGPSFHAMIWIDNSAMYCTNWHLVSTRYLRPWHQLLGSRDTYGVGKADGSGYE
jgi:hypothetical protein